MNLFARILSHGFALVLVALLALGLIYRGDLFPGLKLPAFLTFEQAEQHEAATSPAATASSTAPVAVTSQGEPAEMPQAGADIAAPQAGAGGSAPDTGSSGRETATGIEPEPVGHPAPPAAAEQEPQAEPAGEVPPEVPAAASPGTVPAAASPASGEQPPAGTGPAAGVAQETAPPAAGVVPPEEPAAAAAGAIPAAAATTAGQQPPAGSEAAAGIAQETEPAAAPSTAPEAGSAGLESNTPAVPTVTEMATQQGSGTGPTASRQPVQSAAPGAQQTSPYRVLEAARESYWLRDYATAEKQYNDLINMQPDNPDWYGELGNMYFSEGEWDKASSAYYEAGVRLLKQGMISETKQLVEVIRGLKGSQAADLEQKIKEASASAP